MTHDTFFWLVFFSFLSFPQVLCGAGVYPLPTGRIRCETRNNFTLTLHNNSLNWLSIHSLPTLQLSSNSSPTLSPILTKLSERSAIDKRPGVSCMWTVCQSVHSFSVPSHSCLSCAKLITMVIWAHWHGVVLSNLSHKSGVCVQCIFLCRACHRPNTALMRP